MQKAHPTIAEEQIEQEPELRKKRDSHSVQTELDEHLLQPDIKEEQRVQAPPERMNPCWQERQDVELQSRQPA